MSTIRCGLSASASLPEEFAEPVAGGELCRVGYEEAAVVAEQLSWGVGRVAYTETAVSNGSGAGVDTERLPGGDKKKDVASRHRTGRAIEVCQVDAPAGSAVVAAVQGELLVGEDEQVAVGVGPDPAEGQLILGVFADGEAGPTGGEVEGGEDRGLGVGVGAEDAGDDEQVVEDAGGGDRLGGEGEVPQGSAGVAVNADGAASRDRPRQTTVFGSEDERGGDPGGRRDGLTPLRPQVVGELVVALDDGEDVASRGPAALGQVAAVAHLIEQGRHLDCWATPRARCGSRGR